MDLGEIIKRLDAETLVPPQADHPSRIHDVCAADLLSDILATDKHDFLILTGLVTSQVVRVAEATDALGIVIVRDKKPPQTTIDAARGAGIPLWRSPFQLFESCVALAPLVLEKQKREQTNNIKGE